jgi:phage/plasmid-associated DNA primase
MEQSGYDHGGVGRFLSAGVTREPAARITARDLFTAYTEWMRDNGLSGFTLTEAAFGRAVKREGIPYKRTKAGGYYLGITRKD